jgi:hypothetical protein
MISGKSQIDLSGQWGIGDRKRNGRAIRINEGGFRFMMINYPHESSNSKLTIHLDCSKFAGSELSVSMAKSKEKTNMILSNCCHYGVELQPALQGIRDLK